jgi:hypothetical protein
VGIGNVNALLNARLPVQDWFKTSFTGQVIGGYHNPLYVAGLPGAGSLPSAGINGAQIVSGRSGTIPFPAAVANKLPYLQMADFAAESGVAAAFWVDRLWENSGASVTSTGAQAVTPVALPPRDQNGTANGLGVGIALEVTATLGAATGTVTITYTDSDGNTGNTAVITVPTSCVAGTWIPFPLAANDFGVRALTQITNSVSFLSGSYSLVKYRRVARTLRCLAVNIPDSFGPSDGGGPLYDSSALHPIYILSATSVTKTGGAIQFAQG